MEEPQAKPNAYLRLMLLVALLEPTGFFQYLAVLAARTSKGKPVRLFILLGGITTVLSMFLDNVTTVVIIAPVTLLMPTIGFAPTCILATAPPPGAVGRA